MMVVIRSMFAALLMGLISPAWADTVRVFAAASLRDVLDEAAQAMSDNEADNRILLSYAGSGAIARQVANGAPADLVILANTGWMGWLIDQMDIAPHNMGYLAANRLVLVGAQGAAPIADITAEGLIERLNGGRLAIGQTQSVPAGIYARQWMERAGLWDALAPHLAETENVRAALALVTRAEAPIGVVYASDAAAVPALSVVYDVPQDMHDPIRYPMALLRDAPRARAFADFLRSPKGIAMFQAHGFLPAKDPS